MANNPSTLGSYVGKIDLTDLTNYPHGKARDISTASDGTGTPRVKDEINDIFGFQQAMLLEAGITPSGSPDTALVSQYLEAIKKIVAPFSTLAALQAKAANVIIGKLYYIEERTTGNGGGAYWKAIAKTTENGYNIVTGNATVSFQLVESSIPYAAKTLFPEQWGSGVGYSDDAGAYNAIIAALTNGSALRIKQGTHILGSGIDFTQDDLTIIMDQGAEFYQADDTRALDTLITVSGDRVKWIGGTISANIFNNSTATGASYTGRGESLRWTGDYGTGKNMYFNESHGGTSGVEAGLHVRGIHCLFDDIYCYNVKNSGVRCHGDYNTYKNLRFLEFENKGFVKDSGVGGTASNYTYVHVASAVTSATTALEAVLFDHDTVQGGKAVVEFGYMSAPNMTGPDLFKFAYLDDVTIRGFRGDHKTDYTNNPTATTLRFQQGLKRIIIDDCVFPGAINFGPTTECDVIIKGGSVICDTIEAPVGIDEIAGTLTVEDGCSIKNLRAYAVSIHVDYPESKVNIGRINYHGAATYTPAVINPIPFVSTARRVIAGNITVREPLTITGTMQNRTDDGSWITGSDLRDAACAQMGDRVFLVPTGDFPPREVEHVKRGDIYRHRAPSAGDSIAEYWCTTAGAACTEIWLASHDYTVEGVNTWRFNGSNVYVLTTAGTSAGSGGPTGTGIGIVDGTCVWDYVDTLAVLKGNGSIAA